MLFLRFSSNITPRILLATASSLASCCPNFYRSLAQTAAEFMCVSMARLVASSRSGISACRFWKRCVGTGTEMATDQRFYARIAELSQIGVAVGGAVERKGLAHGRRGAQALRADHLIDEHQVILLHRREVDGLV